MAKRFLVKESEAHVIVLFLGLLLGRRSSSSWSSSCEGARVSQELFHGFSLLECDLCGSRNSQQVLHPVHDAVRHRRNVGIVDGQRNGSHVGNTSRELS